MNRFTVRLPPDLAARFDAAALRQGGRSRLLRRLVEGAADAALPTAGEPLVRPSSTRLTLRLATEDVAALERMAAAAGMSRTQWCAALIRRALHDRPQWRPAEAWALVDIQRDVRRIGVNVNQIARALNTAVLEGVVLDLEVAQIAAFSRELTAHLAAVRAAAEGNLSIGRRTDVGSPPGHRIRGGAAGACRRATRADHPRRPLAIGSARRRGREGDSRAARAPSPRGDGEGHGAHP